MVEIHLTPDQEAFIRRAVQAGRVQSANDAVRQALELWEERERSRAEILADIDQAEASLQAGLGRSLDDQSIQRLVDDVKRLGRIATEDTSGV